MNKILNIQKNKARIFIVSHFIRNNFMRNYYNNLYFIFFKVNLQFFYLFIVL